MRFRPNARDRVTIDARQLDRRIRRMETAYGPKGLREVIGEAARLLERDTDKAFSARTDPNTGRRWPAPAIPQAHPLLQRTGKLRRLTFSKINVGKVHAWVKGMVDGAPLEYYTHRARELIATRRRATERGLRRGHRIGSLGRLIGNYVGIGLLHHYGGGGAHPVPRRRFSGMTRMSRFRVFRFSRRLSDRAIGG